MIQTKTYPFIARRIHSTLKYHNQLIKHPPTIDTTINTMPAHLAPLVTQKSMELVRAPDSAVMAFSAMMLQGSTRNHW